MSEEEYKEVTVSISESELYAFYKTVMDGRMCLVPYSFDALDNAQSAVHLMQDKLDLLLDWFSAVTPDVVKHRIIGDYFKHE